VITETANLSGFTLWKPLCCHTKSSVNATGSVLLNHEHRDPGSDIISDSDILKSFAPGTQKTKGGTLDKLVGHCREQALK
jgi:hypothetical protein